VLFSVFCYFAVFVSVGPPGRGLIVLFFGLLLFFFVGPLENFSADALAKGLSMRKSL